MTENQPNGVSQNGKAKSPVVLDEPLPAKPEAAVPINCGNSPVGRHADDRTARSGPATVPIMWGDTCPYQPSSGLSPSNSCPIREDKR